MRITIVLTLATVLAGCRQAEVREITARHFRVLRIVNGNTFTVTYDGEETRVRFAGIDVLEPDEPDGPAATAVLTELLKGQTVRVEFTGRRKRDGFGRLLCRVWLGEMDVGAEMVRRGFSEEDAPPLWRDVGH